MNEVQKLKQKIEYLESTLADTEKLLFDPLLIWALKHASRVKKDVEQYYNTLLLHIGKLQAGKKKRPG